VSDLYITPDLAQVRFGADQIDVFADVPTIPKIIDYEGLVPWIGISERLKKVTPAQAIQKWLSGFAPAYRIYRAPTIAQQPPDIKRYLTWQLMSTERYERDVVRMRAAKKHADIGIDVDNNATCELDLNFYGEGAEDAIHTLLASRHAISAIQALRAGNLSMGPVSPIRDLTSLDLVDYKQRFQVTITLNRLIGGDADIERITGINLGGKWIDGGTNVPDEINWLETPMP